MRYLTAEDIIKINVMVIGKYSPNEPVGIADPNSLRMIVEQPKQEIFGKSSLSRYYFVSYTHAVNRHRISNLACALFVIWLNLAVPFFVLHSTASNEKVLCGKCKLNQGKQSKK